MNSNEMQFRQLISPIFVLSHRATAWVTQRTSAALSPTGALLTGFFAIVHRRDARANATFKNLRFFSGGRSQCRGRSPREIESRSPSLQRASADARSQLPTATSSTAPRASTHPQTHSALVHEPNSQCRDRSPRENRVEITIAAKSLCGRVQPAANYNIQHRSPCEYSPANPLGTRA